MKKVICIGEALIDVIVQDEQIMEENVGGAPLNVACSIGYLEGKAAFFGAIGNDNNGKKILDLLVKHRVDFTDVQVLTNHKTSIANVSIWDEGERNFTFELDADQNIDFEAIEKKLDSYDIFHFGSATSLLNEKPKKVYMQILDKAVKDKKIIVFDPNWRNLLWENDEASFREAVKPYLQHAHLVKLSEEELQIITQEKNTKVAAEMIVQLYPQAHFLITLGPKGSIFAHKSDIKKILVESAKNVVDTTGAGDAFIAYIIYKIALLENFDDWLKSNELIIQEANEFAKKSIQYKGALTFLK